MSKTPNIPWVEKFRPQQLSDIIILDSLRKIVQKTIDDGAENLPNMLFSGSAGTGKTSLAKLIAKQLDIPVLYINASDENSIDVIRTKVKNFSTSMTVDGKIKIVVMDESDRLCLDENTKLLIGKLNEQRTIKIKDIEPNIKYDIVSFNVETKELENDVCELITDRESECYEMEMENGESIICTLEHPFFVEDDKGNIIEKKLFELNDGDEIIEIN